jgi:hypothetical protein
MLFEIDGKQASKAVLSRRFGRWPSREMCGAEGWGLPRFVPFFAPFVDGMTTMCCMFLL